MVKSGVQRFTAVSIERTPTKCCDATHSFNATGVAVLHADPDGANGERDHTHEGGADAREGSEASAHSHQSRLK